MRWLPSLNHTDSSAMTLLKPHICIKKTLFWTQTPAKGCSGSEQPVEKVKVSLAAEISPGRRVLGAARRNEGSSPELLLTSQARKSWDTMHSTEAQCFPPFLLGREQAKELITNQQWLLAPSMSNKHCALCHFALHLVYSPSQVCLCWDKISALNVSGAPSSFRHSENSLLP